MAPEMVLMLNNKDKPLHSPNRPQKEESTPPRSEEKIVNANVDLSSEKHVKEATQRHRLQGYNASVDWWSLGITLYKLLVGKRPFNDSDLGAFIELSGSLEKIVKENRRFKEYCKLFTTISFPEDVSPEAVDLIKNLLNVDDKLRLGCGKHGARDIKNHPFFASIDWELLELKHVEPPFKPEPFDENDALVAYPDVETVLAEHGKSFWLDSMPPPEYQKYFVNW